MIWYLLIAIAATLALRYLPGVLVDLVRLEALPESPVLLNRDPCPGDADVAQDGWVRLQIAYHNGTTDSALVVITVDGAAAYDGGAGGIQPGWSGWFGTGDEVGLATEALWEACLSRVAPWASEATVAVEVTYDGIPIGSYAFTVADWQPPTIASVLPTDEWSLDVRWDDDMRMLGDGDPADALTAANYAVAVLSDDPFPTVPLAVLAVTVVDARAVRLTFQWEQSPGRRYRLTVSNAQDTSGNAVLPGSTADWLGFTWDLPAGRRWDLYRHMPTDARRLDTTRDLRRITAVWQEVFDLLLHEIDLFPRQLDPDRCRAIHLDALLYDVGNPFPWGYELDAAGKRRLLRILPTVYRLKATAAGIEAVVLFFLDAVVHVLPAAANPLGWVLGESELGEATELFAAAGRARRTFDIQSERTLTAAERAQLLAIAAYMKPAQMHVGAILEPGAAPTFDHWELGCSELGEETILHA